MENIGKERERKMEDERIVSLFWDRREEAIAHAKMKYGKLLYSVAYRILRNREDSEECENDTYFSAWNSIPPSKPDSLAAYLSSICRNRAINRYEYYRAEKRNVEMTEVFEEMEEMVAEREQVEGTYQAKELGRAISKFLWGKDRKKRGIFVARYYFAASVEEIVQAYGVSRSAVKTTLYRMRKELRRYLEQEGWYE